MCGQRDARRGGLPAIRQAGVGIVVGSVHYTPQNHNSESCAMEAPYPLWSRRECRAVPQTRGVGTIEQVDEPQDVGRRAQAAAVDVALPFVQARDAYVIQVVHQIENVRRAACVVTVHVAGKEAERQP